MSTIKEICKPIKNYEGLYEISNFGYVKSLAKRWKIKNSLTCNRKDNILTGGINSSGYKMLTLCKNGKHETANIHLLVWDYFGKEKRNGIILQVDHIDDNKLNNRIDNLQLLAPRDNTTKHHKKRKTSSKFTGVCWIKRNKKWMSHITINKKKVYLGSYVNEIDAHNAYQKKLKEKL